jgi:PBSX family phage terminase large subunit
MIRLSEVVAPSFKEIHKEIKNNTYTHFWFSGGRGSTKSSFISIEIILGIMKDKNANAVVLRKVKDTLRESVHEQLLWAIHALNVSEYWQESVSPLSLTYIPTGQKIVYRGADKPKRIKGIKFSRGYAKYLWYEELDEFAGMEEVRMINQSLMRGGTQFTVFYSYNPPKSANNWVNTEKQFSRPDRLVHHSNYLTVPVEWLGEQFIIEANHLKETKPLAYEHEYLGNVTGTGGEVFDNVKIRKITDEEIQSFENIKRGADFGYAIDPFSYVVCNYNRKYKRLYIYHELYKVGLSNTQAIAHIKEENRQNDFIIADSAEPKSIHEFRQHGLRVKAAKKGPDSIEYGIKFLQDLEEIIIDDTRCPNTAHEFLTYELDKDANGNFKAKFPDLNNHSIDAVRYALNDEVMKHKEFKKQESDPDNPTPSEKHEKMVKKLTGGRPQIKSITKW